MQERNERHAMLNRRQLAIAGAGALALGLGTRSAPAATATIRQGYQTNIWGMPTYYLLKSGYLDKHGIAVEEFAVPSGNLTMQQMVARQVDLGTYAGQSFIIGNAKGGLIAVALIEHVGKTARVTARKDLNISKIEELRGRRIANQIGSSVGNVFVDTIMPQHGLKKGDYVEVRMDVNNMVAALAAKTVDAMVNVEPYNVIAVADGIGNDLTDFSAVDPMPVFMAATPDFVQGKPDVLIAYLKAWLDVAKDFKNSPQKVADVIYKFYADKGYNMSLDIFAKALSRVEVDPGFPRDLQPYMQRQAEILLADKKINAIPDWKAALRPDLMERARAGS